METVVGRGTKVSEKTFAEKAHLKPGTAVAVVDPVEGVVEGLGLPDDVSFVDPGDAKVVFLFVRTRADLESRMPATVQAAPDAQHWVFYRKGSKAAGLEFNRDDIWRLAEKIGMRPIGLLSVDDSWSAFRLRKS